MSKLIYSVYKITNRINNKVYIGFTSRDVMIRFKEHIRSSRHNPTYHLHKSINKYGKKNFVIESIFSSFDQQDSLLKESYFIDLYQSMNHKIGYNTSLGGEGNTMTSLTKQKLSIMRKEYYQTNKHHFLGKKLSEEHKLNIKLNHHNCTGNDNSFFGKQHTSQTKKTISEKMSGSNHPTSKQLKIITPTKTFIVDGIKQFCRDEDISSSLMFRVIKKYLTTGTSPKKGRMKDWCFEYSIL